VRGHQDFQPDLFSYIDIEKLVPPEYLLKRIDRALDLSFIRALTKGKYSTEMGRPSIDPEVFFRIQLVGYIYGIRSERQGLFRHLAFQQSGSKRAWGRQELAIRKMLFQEPLAEVSIWE
jgi:transposase